MGLEDRWNELTEEQRERARQLTTPEEVLEFARENGTELSDADLEAMAGGWSLCGRHVSCATLTWS